MKAIRRFNNNLVLCIDESGTECIARGKGIGFHEIPYEIQLSQIERTYYDVNPSYLPMINEIPDAILTIATGIIDYARVQLDQPLSSNIVFSLADHIQMAVKRTRENIRMPLPILQDIEHLFEDEYEIGEYGVRLVRKKLRVTLPPEEAAFIALHIVNGENQKGFIKYEADSVLVNQIVDLIQKELSISVEKASFNYSRFVSHLRYLLKRSRNHESPISDNGKLYHSLVAEYPQINQCAIKVGDLIQKETGFGLTEEEILYLILHINRLCSQEECYR